MGFPSASDNLIPCSSVLLDFSRDESFERALRLRSRVLMALEEVSDWLFEMNPMHAAACGVSGASIQIPSTETPRGTVIV